MKRADKIKLAQEAAAKEAAADERNPDEREAARKEWGQVRKAAREAFMARGNWNAILNAYQERDGFYTSSEREKMCKAYAEELISNALK